MAYTAAHVFAVQLVHEGVGHVHRGQRAESICSGVSGAVVKDERASALDIERNYILYVDDHQNICYTIGMKRKPHRIVAYLRVSTRRQGESGLGLDAQQAAVAAYAEAQNAITIATYVEVESGKLADRTELQKAVAHAKRSKATLVVAKLDRLARNMAFLATLMDSGVEFVACDNPHANRLTVHILAAVAEDEARRISDRTKAALAAAKRRGIKLGSHRPGHWGDPARQAARLNGLARGRLRSAQVRRLAAREAYVDLFRPIARMRARGLSYQRIADQLNEQRHTTRRGAKWSAMAVKRAFELAAG